MNKQTAVIIRVDDIGKNNQNAKLLISALCSLEIKVACAVVPGWLDAECIEFLQITSKHYPGLVEVHQHGYIHANYSNIEEEYEFGKSRTLEQQVHDIMEGRKILESSLKEIFFPVFTPPYNAFDNNTLMALSILDYCGISTYADHKANKLIPEYSPDIDCFHWHPTREKEWKEILLEWNDKKRGLRGFILHPHLMNPDLILVFINNLASLIQDSANPVTFKEIVGHPINNKKERAIPNSKTMNLI